MIPTPPLGAPRRQGLPAVVVGGLGARSGRWFPRIISRGLLSLAIALPLGQATAQAGTRLVRGRVVDARTEAPVAEAQVFLLGTKRPAVTDGDGQFVHRRLEATSYLMQVRKEGYVVMTWEVMAVEDSSIVHLLKLRPLLEGAGEPAFVSGERGRASLRGRVIDGDTESPLVGADVFVVGRASTTTTDGDGHFRHTQLAPHPHVVQVRLIGYRAALVELMATEDDTVEYVLELYRADAPVMDTVVITGVPVPPTSYWHPDFERRRTEGRGQFVTREQIEQRNAAAVGDLLRTLNGLRLACRPSGCAVWMTRSNCRPAYFVDGFPAEATTAERMPVNDVFGIEVYDLFEVPVELQRSQLRCGVVSVWTRRGLPPER